MLVLLKHTKKNQPKKTSGYNMKIFYLKREEDESGISGTGRVAQGLYLITVRLLFHGLVNTLV